VAVEVPEKYYSLIYATGGVHWVNILESDPRSDRF